MQVAGEDRGHRQRLGLVVGRGRGAVQVEVADVAGVDAAARQRIAHRVLRAEALRVRRRHVVGVAGFAVAAQLQFAGAARDIGIDTFEHGEATGLAQRQADAVGVERFARLGRHQLQCVEAEQHAAAQGIDAADQRRIDHAGLDQACGLREHLRARRARGGDGDARPAQAADALHEIAERMRGVHDRADQVGGEVRLAVGAVFEARIGLFGGADARGRCADHHGHAIGAVVRHHRVQRVGDTVVLHGQPGEAIVAAVPAGQFGRQGDALETVDPADPAVQRLLAIGKRAEIVAAQSAAAFAQRIGLRLAAAAERGGRGVGAHGQWRHARHGQRQRRRAGRHAVVLVRRNRSIASAPGRDAAGT